MIYLSRDSVGFQIHRWNDVYIRNTKSKKKNFKISPKKINKYFT